MPEGRKTGNELRTERKKAVTQKINDLDIENGDFVTATLFNSIWLQNGEDVRMLSGIWTIRRGRKNVRSTHKGIVHGIVVVKLDGEEVVLQSELIDPDSIEVMVRVRDTKESQDE